MSQRQSVSRERIEQFLRRLGEIFRHPARIYLVGGTTLVYEGFREQSLDVDLTFTVADAHHAELVRAIRELKDALSINIEEVSPADFIPLPSGYAERAQFVGRYGQLNVFHFDLYSVALSKIERGSQLDFADVLALLQSSRIAMDSLQRYFDEISVRYGEQSLRQDPVRFRRNFDVVKQAWANLKSAMEIQ
ncbi:MAG: DUF6036 family nucleotidyltransferase [Chloroflexota bacterium]